MSGLTLNVPRAGEARPKQRVLIVQRVLPHYRIAFFNALADRLASADIEVRVVYGQHLPGTVPVTVSAPYEWARFVDNKYFSVLGRELVWQAVQPRPRPNLIVLEHAARLLGNYPLIARRFAGDFRLAFWGHGSNFQNVKKSVLSEGFKRALAKVPDWWFAYTDASLPSLQAADFPIERVTVVQNAVDDNEFREAISSLTPGFVDRVRSELRIKGEHVALYCGGMYPDKRLDFLLEACVRIRETLPEFEVIFVGSGPDQNLVQAAAGKHRWIHYVGPAFGPDRAAYFALSKLLLMPGLVGLAVVDSFVAGVPLVTTDVPIHSPEIAYLRNDVNGLITGNSIEEFSSAVLRLLQSPSDLSRLREGCLSSARVYTLGHMVENFAQGIHECLRIGTR